jgi:hypothetical protein
MTPTGMKMYLYFIVYIMKAPLPIPSKITTRGKTQHNEATMADGRLTMMDFKLEIFIISCFPKNSIFSK